MLRTALRQAIAGPWLRDPLWTRARAVPSLDLDFAGTGSLRDRVSGLDLVTFTRAGDATFVDSTGTVRKALTNLLVRSEEFDNASWGKFAASVSANAATDPAGSQLADSLIEDTSTDSHRVAQGFASTSGTVYTYSAFLKAGGRSHAFLTANGTGTLVGVSVNLTTGAVATAVGSPSNAAAISFPNGWWRVSFAYTSGTTGTISHEVRISADGVWANRLYLGNGTGNILVWGAQLVEGTDPGPYLPTGATVNGAPRFTHDPSTGRALGLLIEEARTNSIRNNNMVGAVAGTPGTLPTNWLTGSQAGLTREIVGTGTVNGINYIDIRYYGTTSSTFGSYFVEANNQIAASNGQTWTASAWLCLVAGSTAGITSLNLGMRYNDAAGTLLTQVVTNVLPSIGTFQRFSTTGTAANASTAFVNLALTLGLTNGAAVDFTLRIGLPQLELGAFVTSVIPTTGTSANRAADVATGTSVVNFNALRTLYVEFASPTSGTRGIVSLNDNTANERLALNTSTADPLAVCVDGGVTQSSLDAGTVTANQMSRFAARFNTNDFAASFNGGAEVTDTSGTLPTVDRIMIGRSQAGEYLNGPIRRIVGWTQALPMLQELGR